jgi:hypothetical protein
MPIIKIVWDGCGGLWKAFNQNNQRDNKENSRDLISS